MAGAIDIVFARKIPAIKRDAQSTAYGTIGANGQNAVAFSDQTQGSVLPTWLLYFICCRKHDLGQTDAFLCPGTSCGSNVSLWVSSQFIVTESHLVCIDYYASSCLLYSLASRSLIVHNSLACQATSTRQRAVTESLGGKPCLGEECFVKLVNAYGDDACMDMNEKS